MAAKSIPLTCQTRRGGTLGYLEEARSREVSSKLGSPWKEWVAKESSELKLATAPVPVRARRHSPSLAEMG